MKRVLGFALLLLAAALIGYGAHTVISNGNCSSTGYVQYGPVPKCSHGSEFLGITGLFFLGPAILFAGWGLLRMKGVTWPIFLAGVGIGALTVRSDTGVASGAKSAGSGIAFLCAVLVMVSVLFTARRLVRGGSGTALGSETRPSAAASRAAAPPATAVSQKPTGASNEDAITKIARLASLRDSGALTEAEFEQQKARLLGEV